MLAKACDVTREFKQDYRVPRNSHFLYKLVDHHIYGIGFQLDLPPYAVHTPEGLKVNNQYLIKVHGAVPLLLEKHRFFVPVTGMELVPTRNVPEGDFQMQPPIRVSRPEPSGRVPNMVVPEGEYEGIPVTESIAERAPDLLPPRDLPDSSRYDLLPPRDTSSSRYDLLPPRDSSSSRYDLLPPRNTSSSKYDLLPPSTGASKK